METIYDESLPVLERIKIPMVWARLECGVRVEDLLPEKYEEALQIAREYYIEDDPMCMGCKLSKHEEATEEYLELIHHWMKDTQSFLAVDDATEEAVGLLVGRVNYERGHTKTMSRTRIHEEELVSKIQRFQAHINKQVDLFESFNTEAYYKVYVWCVASDLRNRGIGTALVQTAIEQTRLFKLPVVMGVFTGGASQRVVTNLGFQTYVEILYWQWKEKDEIVFDNPGAGNNSAELMVFVIEDILQEILAKKEEEESEMLAEEEEEAEEYEEGEEEE